MRREDLKENYVRNFFLENEAFYMDLFDPSQSSKKNIQSVPWFYFINIANTLDKKIGKGCKLDIDNLGPLFRRIALELDLPLKEISINGNKFSKQAVVDALAAVKPQNKTLLCFITVAMVLATKKMKPINIHN
ncbi:MAG: hypothetical protein IPP48_08870 [Chitinophagaceae bacterium]|nr:hypothetical protein [Chitinophagaceae bacterium]